MQARIALQNCLSNQRPHYRAEMATGQPNIRLQLGLFSLYPATGTVPAGGAVQITVDMIAENPWFCEEV